MQHSTAENRDVNRDAGQSPQNIIAPVIILYGLTILAQMISLAFGRLDTEQSLSEIVLPSIFFLSIITLPACYFGLVLGRQMKIGVSQFDELLSSYPGADQSLRTDLLLAAALGVLLGAALLLLRTFTQPYLPPELPELGFRGVAGGLAVSIGAAVAEEVWFRLGLMTTLVWGVTRMKGDTKPSSTVVWSVILISSVAFAAVHLPQVANYGAAYGIGIIGTMVGNILVGTLYGWMYWQKGIIAAIVAHFSVDLVLHVLSVWVM